MRPSRSAPACLALLAALVAPGCGGRAAAAPAAGGSPPGAGPGLGACARPLPEAVAAPAGQALAHELEARGVQIYTCAATETGPAWTFTAPEATLYAADGRVAGKHYAGPTWEAPDGSKVVGAKVAGATPDASSIPWLLLRAASHAGEGAMAGVSFVQRVATAGGLAPSDGCTAATLGAVVRVPYTASYCLLQPR